MKATSYLNSGVTHLRSILCGVLLAGGLGISLTSQVARCSGNPNPGVIPPHARAYGMSYAEWGGWSPGWCLFSGG
jgi:hypothetical protein